MNRKAPGARTPQWPATRVPNHQKTRRPELLRKRRNNGFRHTRAALSNCKRPQKQPESGRPHNEPVPAAGVNSKTRTQQCPPNAIIPPRIIPRYPLCACNFARRLSHRFGHCDFLHAAHEKSTTAVPFGGQLSAITTNHSQPCGSRDRQSTSSAYPGK